MTTFNDLDKKAKEIEGGKERLKDHIRELRKLKDEISESMKINRAELSDGDFDMLLGCLLELDETEKQLCGTIEACEESLFKHEIIKTLVGA